MKDFGGGLFMRHARLAILASTALTLAGAAKSHAADWSGLYIGGNIGYSWGGTVTANTTPFNGTTPSSGSTFTLPGVTIPLKPDGVIGGGQFGYIIGRRVIGSSASRLTFRLQARKIAVKYRSHSFSIVRPPVQR